MIINAVEQYAKEVRETEPRFILYAATWLNGRRWEDEPAGGPANGNSHAKPPEVKDLGSGILEVDSLKMTRETYERKYARQGN